MYIEYGNCIYMEYYFIIFRKKKNLNNIFDFLNF